MTDDLTPGGEPSDRAGPDTAPQSLYGPATAGAMIRAARQEQGIDLASLAAMLKIPLRRLDALENSRHDELQGPTFERALAQASCRVLKIDPKPVLALLPQNERNTLERVTEGINTPFRERQGGAGLGEITSVLRPVVIVPALIVVAALALFYFPAELWARMTAPVVAAMSSHKSTEASAPVPVVATVTSAPVDAGQAASAAPALAASDVAPVAAAPASGVPVEAATAAAAVSATAAQDVDEVLAHVAAPTIPLQVIASADSWIEVVDAQGRPLLSRTVLAGESVGLDGALPMRLKIGNAKATKIKLRGDNVDLAPWTHDNVARLELK